MIASRYPPKLLAVLLLISCATPALANSIAPTAYFLPGVLPLSLGFALPASVLAAVLERPFVTWAGVREHAFWYSLQANFVSLLLGYVTLPVGVYAIYTIGPLWSLIAVGMSVLSEGFYYQWRALSGARLRWRSVVWGNAFSSFVLLLLPHVALAIKEAKPTLVRKLEPTQDMLFWGSVGGSIVVFVLSFAAPYLLRRAKAVPHRSPQVTGVATPSSPELKSAEAAPATGK